MAARDLPPQILQVFNQAAPLTARRVEIQHRLKDPRVRAGAEAFQAPAALNNSPSVLQGPSDSCVLGHLRTRQEGGILLGTCSQTGVTWSAREVVFCE